MDDSYSILSVDGGGIRGLIPALVLREIERHSDEPLSECFDLIAGTSTGGLLALGLTVPKPDAEEPRSAEELVSLYEHQGDDIFDRSPWRAITAMGNVIDSKYDEAGIEGVLKTSFGDRMLSEADAEVIVPSYALERRKPFFFKSRWAKSQENYDFPAWQVARATSAAPTYFEPCKIEAESAGEDYYSLVDGGVFANNPAMCALAEALKKPDVEPEDVRLVSIGTGQLTRRIPHDEASDWGLASWAKPILDVSFDGVADTVDYQVQQILPDDGPRRYFRLQVPLTEGSDSLDDASKTNLRVLRLRAEKLLRDEERTIENICSQVT